MPPNTEPERGRSTARGSSEQFAGGHVGVEIGQDFVATVELRRPPNNYFDATLLHGLADALDELGAGRALPDGGTSERRQAFLCRGRAGRGCRHWAVRAFGDL